MEKLKESIDLLDKNLVDILSNKVKDLEIQNKILSDEYSENVDYYLEKLKESETKYYTLNKKYETLTNTLKSLVITTSKLSYNLGNCLTNKNNEILRLQNIINNNSISYIESTVVLQDKIDKLTSEYNDLQFAINNS